MRCAIILLLFLFIIGWNKFEFDARYLLIKLSGRIKPVEHKPYGKYEDVMILQILFQLIQHLQAYLRNNTIRMHNISLSDPVAKQKADGDRRIDDAKSRTER